MNSTGPGHSSEGEAHKRDPRLDDIERYVRRSNRVLLDTVRGFRTNLGQPNQLFDPVSATMLYPVQLDLNRGANTFIAKMFEGYERLMMDKVAVLLQVHDL
ncbi:MAG: hypothetical protein K2Q01_02685, partial [Rickettsiales bacterium]|nr:hypothetical protein [Rickettsiales bacterium]